MLIVTLPSRFCFAAIGQVVSRGSRVFLQRREGLDRPASGCGNFAFMCPDAEQKLAKCLANDPELSRQWCRNVKVLDDLGATVEHRKRYDESGWSSAICRVPRQSLEVRLPAIANRRASRSYRDVAADGAQRWGAERTRTVRPNTSGTGRYGSKYMC